MNWKQSLKPNSIVVVDQFKLFVQEDNTEKNLLLIKNVAGMDSETAITHQTL